MGALFDSLQRGLGSVLAFFYDLIPNYGISIILLTLAVNTLLFPLTLKQTRSTRAFQKIQPEIRRIQKELKEAPEQMQKELMRVQREAGATPGGCLLPILVQFPIWLALFRVLSAPEGKIPAGSGLAEAVASKTTTFLGMHLDLKVSEAVAAGILSALPYLAMLAIMVASQYIQQWHATAGQLTPDNPQAQASQMVTRIMPLFIGVVSYQFPAGLVLYWMTSNIFRLFQQMLIFRIDGRPQHLTVPGGDAAKPPAPAPSQNPRPQPGAAARRKRRRRR
jgi:YidC/Oxa1 family membrane protein insertase